MDAILDTEKIVFLPLRRFTLQGTQIDKKQTNKQTKQKPKTLNEILHFSSMSCIHSTHIYKVLMSVLYSH